MARLLRIIHYDPSQYMNAQKLTQMTSNAGIGERPGDGPRDSLSQVAISGESYRNSLIEQTRKNNIGTNLLQILSKYTMAGSYLRSITEVVRKVNTNSAGSPLKSRFEPQQHSIQEEAESPRQQRQKMSFEKQARVNSNNPTKSGVISSPDPRKQDDIQILPKSSGASLNLQNQVPRRNVDGMPRAHANSDRLSSEGDDSGDIAGSEDFVSQDSARHNRISDDNSVMAMRRRSTNRRSPTSNRRHIN